MADSWDGFKLIERAPAANADWSGFTLIEAAPQDGEAPPLTIKKSGAKAVAEDVAKSAGVGVAKGAIGVMTAPRALTDMVGEGASRLGIWAGQKIGLIPESIDATAAINQSRVDTPDWAKLPSAAGVQGAVETVTGDFYKPKSTAGKYAQTVGEFAPMAAATGGRNILGSLVKGALVPGIASEAAGQATDGTRLEPWARAGAAIAAGGLASLASRPTSPQTVLSKAAQGASREHIDAAEALFQEAQRMGIPLTRANALDAVTQGATNMSGLQRVVEGAGNLKGFFAPTESGLAQAGAKAFDIVAPRPAAPSTIGPQIGEAAQGTIKDVQGAINQATRPLYKAAEPVQVGAPVQRALATDPVYAQTLKEIRSDPALNATIANLPDDAVGVIDLVQRRLREKATSAVAPGVADSSNLRAANFNDARTAPLTAAEQVTGGPTGSYATARDVQAALRERYLNPLMNGPLGKLQNEPTTKQAIEALFPANPLPNSAGEIVDAVSALAKRRPQAARELVRAHLEGAFNEATQRIQAGPNQWGGANFVAAVKGNQEQAANLAAAVSALPNGQQVLAGLDRFFSVLEATAYRQHIGSQTAFNAETLAMLKQSGMSAEALKIAGGGGLKLPQKVMDSFERWRLGANTAELARLITDPNGAALFKQLATARVGSRQFLGAVARIGIVGGAGSSTAGN